MRQDSFQSFFGDWVEVPTTRVVRPGLDDLLRRVIAGPVLAFALGAVEGTFHLVDIAVAAAVTDPFRARKLLDPWNSRRGHEGGDGEQDDLQG